MSQVYQAPAGAHIGHVHFKVSNLERSLTFYRDLLGFQVTMLYGREAAFVSAGDYHHHIGLNTWYSKDALPASREGTGLYHAAIVYPSRKDLAVIFKRLKKVGYPKIGSSDHGVSEALYLRDPDNNGIELYWDKPKDQWPFLADGSLDMYVKPLDLEDLLKEANNN